MVSGGYAYGYLFMSQSPNAEKVFRFLLEEIKPTMILEIGTFHGGLTLLLRDILDEINLSSTSIITYDINDQEFLKPLVLNKAVDVRTENIFNKDYSAFRDKEAELQISDIIKNGGRTLVLCDGGCKKCEFNIISKYLKINDIIMAHDYAPNEMFFKEHMENKIWDWMEIEDKDIETACKTYNLIPYHQEIAQQAAWLCRVKS